MHSENLVTDQHFQVTASPFDSPERGGIDAEGDRVGARSPNEHDVWSAGDPTVRSGLETEKGGQRIPLDSLPVNLRAEVMDQLAELIVLASGRMERASVIAALVAEAPLPMVPNWPASTA